MSWRVWLLFILGWAGFAASSLTLRDQPRLDERADVLRVRLPILVQLGNAFSDPFLAANLNVFRSLMVDSRITEGETYRIQAQLQVDAAFFNPRHEDNYYVGAAILPWNGQVKAAQTVAFAGAQSRPWDMWPAFFYAFNAMYFERDMAKAGRWAEVAAQRHPKNAGALRAMAAKWYERDDDPRMAMGILKAMHDQSRDENFRRLLQARIQRLEGLLSLREAAAAFRAQHDRSPETLAELVGFAGLGAIPSDPLKLGYLLDAKGVPQLADHVAKRKSQ